MTWLLTALVVVFVLLAVKTGNALLLAAGAFVAGMSLGARLCLIGWWF